MYLFSVAGRIACKDASLFDALTPMDIFFDLLQTAIN